MSHPIDRNAAAQAILAGLAANPECAHLPLELLANHAVRLADLLGARLAEPAPAPAAPAVARNWCGGPLRAPIPGLISTN